MVCDLCENPMPLPDHCKASGEILGLLKCSRCVEDEACARTIQTPEFQHGTV